MPVANTKPVKAYSQQCATPVSGKSTKTVPTGTAWGTDLPLFPFKADPDRHATAILQQDSAEDLIWDFCTMLVSREIKLKDSNPDGKTSPGECHVYKSKIGHSLALYDNGLSIAIAYDVAGCKGEDLAFRGGVDMAVYGANECYTNFKERLVDKCEFVPFPASET
jgi:hypothetical protein